MIKRLLFTDESLSAFIARITLGIVMLPHGLQKLLGMLGGPGFSASMAHFMDDLGIPATIAFLIIIGESFGALGLIAGLISRFCAFGITVIMLGALFMIHLRYGFFMNWFGAAEGEGFEYHLLTVGLGTIVMIRGGGRWSVDRLISEKQHGPASIRRPPTAEPPL